MPPGQPEQFTLIMPGHAQKGPPVKQVVVHEERHPLSWVTLQQSPPGIRNITHKHYGSTCQLSWARHIAEGTKLQICPTSAQEWLNKKVRRRVRILVHYVGSWHYIPDWRELLKTGRIPEQKPIAIFLRHPRRFTHQRPVNGQIRVIPADTIFVSGRVVIRAFVLKLRFITRHVKGM